MKKVILGLLLLSATVLFAENPSWFDDPDTIWRPYSSSVFPYYWDYVYQPSTGNLAVIFPNGQIKDLTSRASYRYRLGTEFGVRMSVAAVPEAALTEIGYCILMVDETVSLTSFTHDKQVTQWVSSTPASLRVNAQGEVTGKAIGNGFVQINQSEYISIIVIPQEELYVVSEFQTSFLPPQSSSNTEEFQNITEYKTEPTFRLSYRFNNKGETRGASGGNGGIDIIARGDGYSWLGTTFHQGGWFYDLNGIQREMVQGWQKDPANGVELRIKPEFIYDKGVPYLQLRHSLYNPTASAVTEQRFGASADVMIHDNDSASLIRKPYGAYMADSEEDPSLELIFIGEAVEGISPVDTLWLGTWSEGSHLSHIYEDSRADVVGKDSAVGFSYQHINLEPGETKDFILRFTLVRNEK